MIACVVYFSTCYNTPSTWETHVYPELAAIYEKNTSLSFLKQTFVSARTKIPRFNLINQADRLTQTDETQACE